MPRQVNRSRRKSKKKEEPVFFSNPSGLKSLSSKDPQSAIGRHIVMIYRNQELLGEVKSVTKERGGYHRLGVDFFNGEPWPVEPLLEVDNIGALVRTFDNSGD